MSVNVNYNIPVRNIKYFKLGTIEEGQFCIINRAPCIVINHSDKGTTRILNLSKSKDKYSTYCSDAMVISVHADIKLYENLGGEYETYNKIY